MPAEAGAKVKVKDRRVCGSVWRGALASCDLIGLVASTSRARGWARFIDPAGGID
jgi:hypothetical protein